MSTKTFDMTKSDNLKILFHSLILAQNTFIIHKNKKHLYTFNEVMKCEECTRLFNKYKQAKDQYLAAINLYLSPKGANDNGR